MRCLRVDLIEENKVRFGRFKKNTLPARDKLSAQHEKKTCVNAVLYDYKIAQKYILLVQNISGTLQYLS